MDDNDPVFGAADYPATVAEDIADTVVIATVSASDADITDSVSYAITGGDPGGHGDSGREFHLIESVARQRLHHFLGDGPGVFQRQPFGELAALVGVLVEDHLLTFLGQQWADRTHGGRTGGEITPTQCREEQHGQQRARSGVMVRHGG